MPDAGTVGGAASSFGDFLQGVLGGKAQAAERDTAERGERFARVGQLFSTAEKMRQDALKGDLKGPERDKLYQEAQSLFSSAMALSGQLDDKPAKAGKKQNPFMQFLSMMNPYSDSSKPPGEFDENFSKIVTAMGPGMGMGQDVGGTGAPGAEAAPGAPGAASAGLGAMVSPATAGGPVGGFSSATEGEVGGMTAVPTPAVPETAVPGDGAAAPGGAGPGGLPATLGAAPSPPGQPYESPYFNPDPEVVDKQKFKQLTEIYTAMRASFAEKGIKTIEDLKQYPQGREIVQHLMFLAAADEFDGFDELDEVYAGLGLQAARSGKDQFEEDYFSLARRAAGQGEPLNEQDQLNFAKMRRLRRTGSDARVSPTDQMFEAAKLRNTDPVTGEIDMDKSFAEWSKATAKEGTQGFSWRTAINPKSGNNEIVSFNNRTGTWEFTNLRVPTGFSINDVMTKDLNQVDQMDGGKIEFFHRQGDFDYSTLEWFLTQIPPMITNTMREDIPNPQYIRLKAYFESVPKPPPPKIATIALIKQYAKSRQESYEQTRTWLVEDLGYTIEGG